MWLWLVWLIQLEFLCISVVIFIHRVCLTVLPKLISNIFKSELHPFNALKIFIVIITRCLYLNTNSSASHLNTSLGCCWLRIMRCFNWVGLMLVVYTLFAPIRTIRGLFDLNPKYTVVLCSGVPGVQRTRLLTLVFFRISSRLLLRPHCSSSVWILWIDIAPTSFLCLGHFFDLIPGWFRKSDSRCLDRPHLGFLFKFSSRHLGRGLVHCHCICGCTSQSIRLHRSVGLS